VGSLPPDVPDRIDPSRLTEAPGLDRRGHLPAQPVKTWRSQHPFLGMWIESPQPRKTGVLSSEPGCPNACRAVR
jgi:hypothetical protein